MKAQVTETVTITQAKTALEQTAVLYFSKDSHGSYRMDRHRARPVCLMGPAGIGKTEIVRQVAQEQGLAFLSYSVTHHTRQSVIGLPKLSECTADGKTVPITEYTMSEIVAEVYRTMEESGKHEGILFLDEFNCASETLRPVMLQLLQTKSLGPHRIPDGWMIVLAGNPSEYNAAAGALDAVTADRMRLLWLRPDYSAWREYMTHHGVHPIVLSYLDDHRKHFYVFEKGADGTGLVTARGWEDLSVMLRMMEQHSFPVDLPFIAQFIQCAQVAREFLTYYLQYSKLIESGLPDKILTGQNSESVYSEVERLSFTERWALTSVLLLRIENLCEDNASAALSAIEHVLSYYQRSIPERAQFEFLVNGITNSDPCAQLLAAHPSEVYRQAADDVFFSDNSPSTQLVRKLLKQAG